MTNIPQVRASLWGRFRFAVVGTLLSSPPLRGQLKAAIRDLAAKTWTHPVTGRDVHFSAVTIERWYYTALRQQDDPVGSLRRAVRKDCGHLDFHHGSLKVLSSRGQWQHPLALAILDDHSRLCCHAQWYLSETAADLVHGLSQAIQKRGLPRALMTDNGSAMVAEEVVQGLLRLGIVHERTLPYSAYQNGKQEAFWGNVEGRLLAMLEGHPELTLAFLNEATQAWVEIEYNRAVHRELACAPVERFAKAPDVLRSSPSSDVLREAFRLEDKRRQRHSDGTISLEGVRFEVPARYRHFREVTVRYARWDLTRVDLVDPRHGTLLAPLYPLDRTANADGRRAAVAPASADAAAADPPRAGALPPLLQQLLADYAATGLPPAYLPQRTLFPEEPA
jgi:putative transposase